MYINVSININRKRFNQPQGGSIMARNNKASGFTRSKNFNEENKPMSFTDTVTEEVDLEELDSEVTESEELDNESTEENLNETKKNDRIDNLLGEEKVNKKILRGFHLEPEISEAIDEATKNKIRGSKTKLVNILLEKGLKDNGLL